MNPAKTPIAADSFDEIATVRIELKHTDPLIWRQVEAPTSITLKVLHDIVQATIGWRSCHLWQFAIAGRAYGPPMDDDWGAEPPKEASKVRLREVLRPRKTVIGYLYDFGDGWEHEITVTDVRPGQADLAYPRYIGGQGAGPPEDCGGIPGFYEMLAARADLEHPEHRRIVEWLDDYDPDALEELPIRNALGRLAARREATKSRIAKAT